MHISHVCSGIFRWIVPRGSPRRLLQKRKLKQLKSLSVCPVRYLLLFFMLKRRLREISTYYFVFIFFKCVFTLVIKSALFLNSRVWFFFFSLTQQTQRERESERKIISNSTRLFAPLPDLKSIHSCPKTTLPFFIQFLLQTLFAKRSPLNVFFFCTLLL